MTGDEAGRLGGDADPAGPASAPSGVGDPDAPDLAAAPGGDPVEDPDLHEVAEHVRRVLHHDALDPTFRDGLRTRLVAARAEVTARDPGARLPDALLGRGTARGPGSITLSRGRDRLRRPRLALSWATAVAATVAGAVIAQHAVAGPESPVAVVAFSDVIAAVSADPTGPVRLRFSPPLDHASTSASLRVTPATTLETSWQGDTLEVIPAHGFAANSAYVLTIDRAGARTAGGAPLMADLTITFGTAPAAGPGPAPAPPVALPRDRLAGADDGSEAVVARDGSVLLSAARPDPGSGDRPGLVRVTRGTTTTIGPATSAICVSRSGGSIAYLVRDKFGSQIVIADAAGNPQRRVPVNADPGTPLGWIGDSEVSAVIAGRLTAVDRSGHLRTLVDTPVDAAHDELVIAPGGRFAYYASESRTGHVVDLQTGQTHPLAGITGKPAFSADGSTVVWAQEARTGTRLASAPSAGGPTRTAPLTLPDGARASDLSISPDGSRLAYSVGQPDGRAQLRLASLPDGDTLAVSDSGAGQSFNWAPGGDWFTALSAGPGAPQIEVVRPPAATIDIQARVEATARAFANAQVGADPDAQRAIATAATAIPAIPAVTRSTPLWTRFLDNHTAVAGVRLTIDPTPGAPSTVQAEETLTIDTGSPSGAPSVTAVALDRFAPAPAGPQLTRLDTDADPGAVLVAFDSDLDPRTVADAITLTRDGGTLASTIGYDPTSRTATIRPVVPEPRTVDVQIAVTLKDVNGRAAAERVDIPVHLASPP